MKKLLLIPLLLLSSIPPLAAESGYVQSAKGKIMAEPNFRAEVLTTLGKGAEVEIIETQKRWLRVQHEATTGWLSSFLVKKQPPIEKVSVLTGDDSEMKGQVRRRASAAQAAGATRGLTADDRRRTEAQSRVNYQSLGKIERIKISPEEIANFAAGGNL